MFGFKSLVMVAALCAVCFDTTAKWQMVAAQESDAPADVVVEADPEASDEKKEPAEGEENSEEKAQAFMDSAQDLQDKLDQLNALLEAKGDSIDPELKERILGLKSQLGGLGLDGLGASSPGSNKELSEFLIQCLDLTVRRVGKTHKTINTMAKLADAKYTKEDAAKNDFWRMAISCISEAGEEDLAEFKAGTVKKLPKAFVDKAQSPEGEKKVLDLDDQLWQELKAVVPQLVKAYTGNTGEEAPPPTIYGLLAFIPLGLGVAFMAKLYFDEQKRKEANKSSKQKKSEKKGSSERAATPAKSSSAPKGD